MIPGGALDYDRLCAALGRTWGYITPAYFYMEMDLFDVAKLAPFMAKGDYEACWRGKAAGSGIEQLRKDGVIKEGSNG